MNLKIQKIILWPKNPVNTRREIVFKCSGVEVISGWSQKGKSALIQIVDYCLGSEKCAIPVGHVRDKVEWFGLVLVLDKKKIVVARRNPGNQASSSEMMWVEGQRANIPDQPYAQESRDSVISRFDELASLPTHGNAEDMVGSFDGPPSFRDMASFIFQPQHIIANPNTLFFKADTSNHREKLIRSVFPYVLGAVDAATLAQQAKLRKLEHELKVKKDQLNQMELASAMWKGRLQNFAALLQQHELLPDELVVESSWTVEKLVDLLRPIPQTWKTTGDVKSFSGLAKQTRRQILALQSEGTRLMREIGDAERKARKMGQLQSANDGYRDALSLQSERLSPSLWLVKKLGDSSTCPMCGGLNDAPKDLLHLAETARQMATIATKARGSDDALSTEITRLEDTAAKRRSELGQIEERLRDWEQKEISLKDARSRGEAISNLVGQLTAAIETIDEASPSGKLKSEVAKLTKDVEVLEKKVNYVVLRSKVDKALANISRRISHYAKILKVEHAEQVWSLDDRNLTLSTKGPHKTDYLWEIGSAANWMGYHVATMLALHEHFRGVLHNPVPKFLILDQPSQAFFPEGLTIAKKAKSEQRVSDDLARLKRLFAALAEAVDRTDKGLQIILLEHAEPETWEGVPDFSMPDGEWRAERALIPLDWK